LGVLSLVISFGPRVRPFVASPGQRVTSKKGGKPAFRLCCVQHTPDSKPGTRRRHPGPALRLSAWVSSTQPTVAQASGIRPGCMGVEDAASVVSSQAVRVPASSTIVLLRAGCRPSLANLAKVGCAGPGGPDGHPQGVPLRRQRPPCVRGNVVANAATTAPVLPGCSA